MLFLKSATSLFGLGESVSDQPHHKSPLCISKAPLRNSEVSFMFLLRAQVSTAQQLSVLRVAASSSRRSDSVFSMAGLRSNGTWGCEFRSESDTEQRNQRQLMVLKQEAGNGPMLELWRQKERNTLKVTSCSNTLCCMELQETVTQCQGGKTTASSFTVCHPPP